MASEAGDGEGDDLTSPGSGVDASAGTPAAGSPAQRYRNWKRFNESVACLFARTLASRPEEHGQAVAVIRASSSAKRIATSIDRKVREFAENPQVTGATILLPKVASLRMLLEAVIQLKNCDGWALSVAPLQHQTAGDLATLALTRSVPSVGGELPSEVLIFGDFDVFPPTRRAPVVALELYVGKALEFDPKDGVTPSTRANLAHIAMPSLSEKTMAKTLANSAARRTQVLGGEDLRAKARVSFVVPRSLADELGLL